MRIGITGHQHLENSETWSWVAHVIRLELSKQAPPFVAVTSLAIGADQLLARIILELGGMIEAIIPYADIERSFTSESERQDYRELAGKSNLHVLNTQGKDEDAYLAAGIRVVKDSDILIAVWNGQPAKGKGGTADIVRYALSSGIPIIHIEPVGRTVQYLGGKHTVH